MKNSKVHLVEKGLNKLRLNLAEVNPTYKIEPEVCLALLVESEHALSHFKHPPCTFLEYARECMNRLNTCLNGQHITLLTDTCIIRYLRTASPSETIVKISPMPLREMSQADQMLTREWAQEHGKVVCQHTEIDTS